jgi:hypothetical protein
MVFLDRHDWEENTKEHYYLAQIAAMIQRVMEGFRKTPRQVKTEDFLIKFTREKPATPVGGQVTTDEVPVRSLEEAVNTPTSGGIEIGPEAVLDPKWAVVNTNAKTRWAALLGVPTLETSGGDRPTST